MILWLHFSGSLWYNNPSIYEYLFYQTVPLTLHIGWVTKLAGKGTIMAVLTPLHFDPSTLGNSVSTSVARSHSAQHTS